VHAPAFRSRPRQYCYRASRARPERWFSVPFPR
jgi:hypothetical protein